MSRGFGRRHSWAVWMGVLALLVVLAAAGRSYAGTNGTTLHLGRPGQTITTAGNSGRDTATVFGCVLGDTQSEVSQKSYIQQSPELGCRPWQNTPLENCEGFYCTDSPYCDGSWRNTARRLMRNRAYGLTGQWSLIDFTGLDGDGTDAVQSHWTQPLNHPRCDFIVSLGDMADTSDGIVATDPTYAQLSAQDRSDADIVREFWEIIKASGIPFLPLVGNHDVVATYRDLMATHLNFTALPFYYAREPTKQLQYAIKFPTATGKDFCVIGMMSTSSLSADTMDATQLAWVTATVGCGANLPTILVQHEGVTSGGSCVPTVDPSTVISTVGTEEVFMIAGGHNANSPSCKAFGAGPLGLDQLAMYSDWQTLPRHDLFPFVGPPYGNSSLDSAGLFYTVLAIEPQIDRLCAWDWATYWQRTEALGIPRSGIQAEITSRLCVAFDFNARFP